MHSRGIAQRCVRAAGACWRWNSVDAARGPLKVCIVGGGPAGFYTAHQLVKKYDSVQIDILEKFPVPFGLMRFGVAPDHVEVKNCIKHFTTLAKSEQCRFIGNVCMGRDMTLAQLRPYYHGLVMAYGAEDSRTLGVPGENIPGVHSARAFVGWYNGLPEHRDLNPDLSGEEAVVIGQGNVAMDVARMLLTPVDILKKTDICQHALEALAESKVRRVQMVGRRGPLQVSFTIKELREMTRLPGCKTVLNPKDFDPVRELLSEVSRPRKRITELMMKTADATGDRDTENLKEWNLLFLRSPVEILPSQTTGRVGGVRLEINRLEKVLDDGGKVASYQAVGTGEYEDIKCDMLVRSISFKSFPVDKDLPYDPIKGIIPNVTGRVVDGNKNQIRGLYCSGWAKTTPIGVLLTTMAFETADAIVKDFKEEKLLAPSESSDVLNLLKNLPGVEPVTFSEWEAIDEVEKRVGEERGKPREKVVEYERMMQIAKKVNQFAAQ